MRALYWNGVNDLRVGTVPDPTIVNPHDAILKVTLSTTCGSDLHFIDGYLPTMKPGDIIGHEFMGEVVETGPEVEEGQEGRPRGRPVLHRLRPVLVLPAPALLALRQHAPEARAAGADVRLPDGRHLRLHPRLRRLRGRRTPSTSACPFADNDCFHAPEGVPDEQVLFLSDAAPTGYMGADFCDIQPGDTIAVWGCGGVGLMAQQSAYLLGAERVIAIDRFPSGSGWPREKSAPRPSTTWRSTASSRRSRR